MGRSPIDHNVGRAYPRVLLRFLLARVIDGQLHLLIFHGTTEHLLTDYESGRTSRTNFSGENNVGMHNFLQLNRRPCPLSAFRRRALTPWPG